MSKKFDYIITLKSSDDAVIRLISQILIFISVISLGFFAVKFYSIPSARTHAFILFGLIAIIVLIWIYVASKKYTVAFRWAFFIAGLAFLFYFPVPVVKYFIAGLYIIIGLLEGSVKFNKEICVDENGILINAIPDKFYEWKSISNAMIKDGLFTMDLKNNQIYQKEIEGDVPKEAEKEFNEFCKKYLAAPVA